MSNILEKDLNVNESVSVQKDGELSVSVDPSSNRPEPEITNMHVSKGMVGSGTHGGQIVPLTFKEVLAGSTLSNFKLDCIVKMEPLAHVNFSKLCMNVAVVFVPHSRVWKDYDRFMANIKNPLNPSVGMPRINCQGLIVRMPNNTDEDVRGVSLFREMLTYCYYGTYRGVNPYNPLLIRGYIAANNDIFTDKKSNGRIPEFNDNSPSTQANEENLYFRLGTPSGEKFNLANISSSNLDIGWGCLLRAPSSKNFWNSYHFMAGNINNSVDNTNLHTHNVTQRMIDEYRQASENINKTDAEVMAELRGVQQAKENECVVVGRDIIDLDISLIASTNENEQVQLGAEGAISYTKVDMDIPLGNFTPKKDGFLHVFYWISFKDNSLYPETQNYEVMKFQVEDFYRPTLKEHKDVPLTVAEIMSSSESTEGQGRNRIVGYRRRFSEYFRMPCVIRGDFQPRTVTPSNQFPIFRDQGGGFKAPSLAWNGVGSVDTVRLPTKFDYTGLRSNVSNHDFVHDVMRNGCDVTDYTLRRFLLHSGDGLLDQVKFRLCTPQTFSIYGEVSITNSVPIAPEIANNIIANGDM